MLNLREQGKMAEQTQSTPIEDLKGFIGEQIGKTVDQIDEMDGRIDEALETLKKTAPIEVVEQIRGLATRLEEEAKRLDAIELSKAGAPGTAGGDSEILESIKKSAYLGRIRNEGPRSLVEGVEGLKVESLLKVAVDTSANPVPVTYRPGVVEYALFPTALAMRVPKVPCAGNTYSWLQENQLSGAGGIVTTVDGAIVGGAGATIKFTSVSNLENGSRGVVQRTDGAGTLLGYETFTVSSFNPSTRVVTMTATVAGNIADGDTIQFTEFTATAESSTKPYGYLETAYTTKNLEMIASLMELTRQVLNSDSTLEAWVQRRMARTNMRNISYHLLYGTGANQQLQGFLSLTGRQTYNWSSGVTGDTMADALARAALLIPDETALEVTMSRSDWLSLKSEKMVTGEYIHGQSSPMAVIDTPTLKSVGPYRVNIEPMLKANGDFLIADHGQASELAQRGNAQFLFGYVASQFAQNKITARYEEELLHAILSTQWYVHGNFDSRP
jgi:hypothetical protein